MKPMDMAVLWKENWLRALKSRVARYVFDTRLSEPALLQRELDERDRVDPDWDERAHRAALRAGLDDGADRDHLVRLYGEDAVCEEEAAMRQEQDASAAQA